MKTLKILSLIFLFFITINIFSQEINKTKIDEKSQMEILIGVCNREGLKSVLFKTYYEEGYNSYKPDSPTINNLTKNFANKNIKITIVMGSWNGESQECIPRFFKILDGISFLESNVRIYCVDRSKKSDIAECDQLAVLQLPTLIFYLDGKEVGRLSATSIINLEKEIENIFL